MKFLILLTFLVVVLIASTEAQRTTRRPGCPQGARPATCVGPRNVGTRCTLNRPRRMWYYNAATGTCLSMEYLGCGGNANRWCNRRACQRACAAGPRPS